MKEKSNYWDTTQFTDLSQFLMAIQKLAEKKQETLQENKNKKAIENFTEPVKPLKKQRKKKKKKKTRKAKTSRLGFSNMDTYMSEEELQKRKKKEKRKRREARKKRREGRKK